MWHLSLWLTSLTMTVSASILVAADGIVLFFFMSEYISLESIWYVRSQAWVGDLIRKGRKSPPSGPGNPGERRLLAGDGRTRGVGVRWGAGMTPCRHDSLHPRISEATLERRWEGTEVGIERLTFFSLKVWIRWDPPGGPGVRTPHSLCRVLGLDLWSGNQDPACHRAAKMLLIIIIIK